LEKAFTEAAVCTITSGGVPTAGGLFGEVGDGAGSDDHHPVGPRDGGRGLGEGCLVHVQGALADGGAPDLEAPREQTLHLVLEVSPAAAHRGGVHQEHDARAARELQDDLEQKTQRFVLDLDPAHAHGGESPSGVGEPQGLTQAVEVGGVGPPEPAGPHVVFRPFCAR
jgi:hypothetical protein